MSNSSSWWDKKLGGGASLPGTPATAPMPGNVYRPPAQTPNVQVAYDPNQDQLISKAVIDLNISSCTSSSDKFLLHPGRKPLGFVGGIS